MRPVLLGLATVCAFCLTACVATPQANYGDPVNLKDRKSVV